MVQNQICRLVAFQVTILIATPPSSFHARMLEVIVPGGNRVRLEALHVLLWMLIWQFLDQASMDVQGHRKPGLHRFSRGGRLTS